MSTLSSTITSAVVLGSGTYSSPLTITAAGYVAYAGHTGAAVSGIGTVVNLGSIIQGPAAVGYGVSLSGGGVVINGQTGETPSTALIEGYNGVGFGLGAAGTLTNYGTVTGHYGVALNDGGTVINGGATATTASIYGSKDAVLVGSGSATITNYGTISGDYGVVLNGGGTVVNGAVTDTTAAVDAIGQGVGIQINNVAAVVTNFGTVANGSYGVVLDGGGSLVNGVATSDTSAVISGAYDGVYNVTTNSGTVTNYGTITGADFNGIRLAGDASTVTNFGTITGGVSGIELTGSADVVVNYGVIAGDSYGVLLTDTGATLVDAGSINGNVQFNQPNGLLVLEAGYSINGSIIDIDGSGTLELLGNSNATVLVNYNNLALGNFSTVQFAPGDGGYGRLLISSYTNLPGIITGFTGFNDVVDLTNLPFYSADTPFTNFNTLTDVLTVSNGNGKSVGLQLGSDTANYQGVTWNAISDGGGGITIYRVPGSVPETVTISSTAQLQGVAAGSTDTPFGNVSITDSNSAATEQVTVIMSDPAGGTLSNLGTLGIFNDGTYTDSGTPAQVSADLDALVFTPAAPASGDIGTSFFTIDVTGPGGVGDTATDDTTSVTVVKQILGLSTVLPSNIVISVSSDGSSFANANDTKTNEAVVLNPMPNTTYLLPTGYQAEFLGGAADPTLSDPSVGNALLVGNSGIDTISSGAANDTIVAGINSTTTLEFVTGATNGRAYGAGASSVTMQDAGTGDVLIAGSGAVTASLSGSGGAFFGGSGADSAVASGSHDTLTGGSDQTTFQFTASAMDDVVFGAASVSMSDAGTNDVLVGSAGTTLVTLSGANGTFYGEAGNITLTDSGHGDTLLGGSGQTTFNLSSSTADELVFGGTVGVSISDAGAGDTLIGAGGATAVTLSGSGATFFGEAGGVTLSDKGHNDVLVAGSGQSTFDLTGSAANELVFGGAVGVSVSDAGNGDTLVGAGGTTAATLSGADATFFGEAGNVTLTDNGHGDTMLGGSGQMTFNLGISAADELVFGGAIGASISDAGNGDTLVGAAGATFVTLSGADATFFGEAGNATLTDSGHFDTLRGGSGHSTISLTGSAFGELAFGGSSATMSDAGAADTLVGATGTTVVTLAGSDAMFYTEAGGANITDTGHSDTVVGGSAATTVMSSGTGMVVFGESGLLSFIGGNSGATILGGSGGASVTGGSGGTTLFGGAGGTISYAGSIGEMLYRAGSGSEALDASSSTTNNVMFGGNDVNGHDTIIGGQGAAQGNDTLVAGSTGADTLMGNSNSSSSDWFTFINGNSGDVSRQATVVNFNANDEVWLSGYGSNAAATALATATYANGSTTITLSDLTTITFAGIANVSSLTSHVIS